jgi:amino acid transporter
MCYAELSSLFPHAGGDYTFLHKAYSLKGESLVSFLFAWAQILVIRPASIVILALIFGDEIKNILVRHNIVLWQGPLFLAMALVVFVTFVNILGIKEGKTAQNMITGLKFLICGFIIVYGSIIILGGYSKEQAIVRLSPLLSPEGKSFWQSTRGFWSALVLTMWVYGGWNEAAYVAEEVKKPHKDIPRALFMGIFAVTLLYIGINLVYLFHFSPKGLSIAQNPANNLMIVWFGAKGGIIMSSIIAVSAAGAVNGLIMTGGRMSYAFALNTPSLKNFAGIHEKHRTPSPALLANLIITLVLLVMSRGRLSFVETLTFYTSGIYWFFFGMVVISLIIFRVKIAAENIPFKVPLYPYAPVLFLIITGSLIWGSIQYKPFETLAGVSILILGIPIYYLLHFNLPENSLHLNVLRLPLDENDDRRQNTMDRRQNPGDRRRNREDRRKADLGREAAADPGKED